MHTDIKEQATNETVFQALKEDVAGILNDICLFGDCELGRIVGLAETDEDYYYIAKKLHGERVLLSCVGSVLSLKAYVPKDHYANMDAIYAANHCGPVNEIVIEHTGIEPKSVGLRVLDMAVSDADHMPERDKLIALWEQDFKTIFGEPLAYQNALSRLNNVVAQVDLFYNNETGDPLWSLVDTSKDDGFWFESFSSKEHALNFIKGVGWDLRNVIDPEQKHGRAHKLVP
jgi:hypothetical protein